jgi:hypothetical protein
MGFVFVCKPLTLACWLRRMLNVSQGRFFLVETNYDHWKPAEDSRRQVANDGMTNLGPQGVSDAGTKTEARLLEEKTKEEQVSPRELFYALQIAVLLFVCLCELVTFYFVRTVGENGHLRCILENELQIATGRFVECSLYQAGAKQGHQVHRADERQARLLFDLDSPRQRELIFYC